MITLEDFDPIFFNSLEDKNMVLIVPDGRYHTICCEGKPIGVIGCVPYFFNSKKGGFSQTVIIPEFRGRGINALAKDLLVKKHNLNELQMTIKEENIRSIRANEKIGFQKLDEERLRKLRVAGFLKEDEIRLVKYY